MVEITHNGLPSQSIRLAYEYLREALGHSSGYAKKLFKEMEKPEKLAMIATAEAWARANGGRLRKRKIKHVKPVSSAVTA